MSNAPYGDGSFAPPVKAPDAGGGPTNDDKLWALFAHLSPLLVGFIGPLIIWLVMKDKSAFVAEHAKESLNFCITMIIASLVLMCTFVGPFALFVFMIVVQIQAAMEANKGGHYQYPLCIRFIS